jgi:hypothetical protein
MVDYNSVMPNKYDVNWNSRKPKAGYITILERLSGKAAVAQKKGLKQGDVIDLESLAKEHAWPYRCPSGGKYSINRVGENPTCSITDHKLSEFLP